MSSSKEIYLFRDFEAGVYLSEVPSPPRFKLQQNMVSNTTQHPLTPAQPHTVCLYCTLTLGVGRG